MESDSRELQDEENLELVIDSHTSPELLECWAQEWEETGRRGLAGAMAYLRWVQEQIEHT